LSADVAKQYAIESYANRFLPDQELDIEVRHMLAWEASAWFRELGFDPLPLATSLPDCGAVSCPFPGVLFDESGYLVIVRGLPDPRAISPIEPDREAVAMTWISDQTAMISAPPRYPRTTHRPVPADKAPSPIVFGQRFLAGEASQYLDNVGLNGFSIQPEGDTCPPEAGCRPFGEPADAGGCLIVVSGVEPGDDSDEIKLTWAHWVSDTGDDLGMRREQWADLPIGIEPGCREAAASVGVNVSATPDN
jgi:hypothetical protein